MVWKVAGLLVKPKNMTKGLKSPWWVQKAAFHLSPFFIQMLLKPHQTLSLVKYQAHQSLLTNSEINRSGYLFFTVIALMSGDTHFLQHLHCLHHYLPFHLLTLFLSNINNHLQTSPHVSKHCVESLYLLLYSFHFLTSPSMDFGRPHGLFTNGPCVYFYLHLSLFLSLFLSSFLMLLCLTFYF